jgi:hypothetical protein
VQQVELIATDLFGTHLFGGAGRNTRQTV